VSVKLDGFRLESLSDPLSAVPPVPGRFRFDAPDGSYPVTYVCSDELGCFAEVFGDRKLIEARDGERRVLRLGSRPARDVHVHDRASRHVVAVQLCARGRRLGSRP
jgi:hypothetical protein